MLMQEKHQSLAAEHAGLVDRYDHAVQNLAAKESAVIQLEARVAAQDALFKEFRESFVLAQKPSKSKQPDQPA